MAVRVNVALLDRTVRIRFGANTGSGLYIELAGTRMVLTAAHLVEGLVVGDKVGIRHGGDWQLLEITGVSRCREGTDVCALRPRTQWGEAIPEEWLTGDGLYVSEEVAFCGFPLNLEMMGLAPDEKWPRGLVKGGVFSGPVKDDQDRNVLLFDAINNSGYSGGPVVRNTPDGALRIVALISGYRWDNPLPVYRRMPDGSEQIEGDFFVKPNSGFMIGVPTAKRSRRHEI